MEKNKIDISGYLENDHTKPNLIGMYIRIQEHLEIMAAAYSKATNIPIQECELVVEQRFDKVVYYFQKRGGE